MSHFQVSRNRKRDREFERVVISQKEKEQVLCLNREAFTNSLKKKLVELFKENLWLRQDCLKRRLKWIEENVKYVLLIFFKKLADGLNPRGWNSIRQINGLIKVKRGKSWLCEELDMRNTAFQEDRVRGIAKNSKNYENFAVLKQRELDN